MVTIIEYSKETNNPTGMYYTVSNCAELTDFNRNFDYSKFFGQINSKKLMNMQELTAEAKSILNNEN